MYNLKIPAGQQEQDILTVVLIGVGVVFLGLVCIVILCKIIGWIFGSKKAKEERSAVSTAPVVASTATAVTQATQPIENRQQIIAAVSAAVAEELGTDVSAIRILSFKKI